MNYFKHWARSLTTEKVKYICVSICICLLISMTIAIIQAQKDKTKYNKMLEVKTNTIIAEYEGKIIDLIDEYEAELRSVRTEYENGVNIEGIEAEAESIAKVLYGTARANSKQDQRTVVWCILNRVDHNSYPDTVQSVCEQSSQWIGYSSDNPILEELYDIAINELKIWHDSNRRPVSNDYVYMSWSSDEILLRNTYERKTNTRYWQAD